MTLLSQLDADCGEHKLPDDGQLPPMMGAAERNAGERPMVVTADAGYWNTDLIEQTLRAGIPCGEKTGMGMDSSTYV